MVEFVFAGDMPWWEHSPLEFVGLPLWRPDGLRPADDANGLMDVGLGDGWVVGARRLLEADTPRATVSATAVAVPIAQPSRRSRAISWRTFSRSTASATSYSST
jgi:hypothetical protein